MPRPWRPGPALQASAAVHAAAAVGTLISPASWPLTLAAVAVNHALIGCATLWPRSQLFGPNLLRLPATAAARNEIALTFDDGPDPEVTPRVLDLLDAHAAKATFFCIGQRAQRFPALLRDMVARGHAVENHTYRHPNHFSLLGPRAIAREIIAAQHALADITGTAPKYFRAVAGFRNPFLDPVLARHDLWLATWSHRAFDTVVTRPQPALQRLARNRAAGDILLLHDGHSAITSTGQPLILTMLPVLLAELQTARLKPVTLSHACHPTPTGQSHLEPRP